MLEIILLSVFTQRIGALAAEKGRARAPYQWLFVLLWIGGEVSGALVGLNTGSADQCATYIFALLGATLGAGIGFLLVSNLPSLPPTVPATSADDGVVG